MPRERNVFLPRDRKHSFAADYRDFRAHGRRGSAALVQNLFYVADVALYSAVAYVQRRVRLAATRSARELLKDPFLYGALVCCVPHAYAYVGLLGYFLHDGQWLDPTGHFPMVLGGGVELLFWLLIGLAGGGLAFSAAAKQSVTRRPSAFMIVAAALLLAILLSTAART